MAARRRPPCVPVRVSSGSGAGAGFAEAIASMQHTLLEAAYNGDLPLLKRLVRVLDNDCGRIRAVVEAARTDEGNWALQLAAGNQQLEMCSYLVETLGVDVDSADNDGRTPLVYAVHSESAALVKYLLDHDADPNKADNNQITPLHSAAGIGDCEMIELLLAKGAYIDPIADEIGTPLHLATKEQKVSAVKTLLDHNADCNKTYMMFGLYPTTALFQAVNVSSVQCVKLLVEAGAVINSDCISAVSTDSATGKECLKFLLEADANRNAPNGAAVRASTRGGVAGPARQSGGGRGRGQGQRRRRERQAVCREEVEVKVDLKNEQANKRKVEQLKSFASKAIERKDYTSASAFYTKAIDVDPNDATLFSNRSLCWLRTGDGPKALLDALDCREMRPDWPKACYRQGAALMLLKDYEGACDALLDGLKLDPKNAEMESALREAMESLKISKGDTKAT